MTTTLTTEIVNRIKSSSNEELETQIDFQEKYNIAILPDFPTPKQTEWLKVAKAELSNRKRGAYFASYDADGVETILEKDSFWTSEISEKWDRLVDSKRKGFFQAWYFDANQTNLIASARIS